MKKVIYLCHYVDDNSLNDYIGFPSAHSKVEYIVKTLQHNNCFVNVVSAARIKRKGFIKAHKTTNKDICVQYFSSFKTGINIIDKLGIVFFYFQLFCYLLKTKEQLIVYHSLFYCDVLRILKKIFKKDFLLEIEDVYSDVNIANKKDRKKEWRFFEVAKKCIVVNDLIFSKISNAAIVSYGKYELPPIHLIADRDTNHIDLIYAGVIEQIRKAAFVALDTMMYLDNSYRLTICGFGNEVDILKLKNKIREINQKKGKECIRFLGKKEGKEYEKILQTSDIALSTHVYNEENIQSANGSFPSKVLVYLANNLRVVAQELEVLKISKIGDLLYYYENPNPFEIAETIKNIDLNDYYDGRKRIAELDKEFQEDIKKLMELKK